MNKSKTSARKPTALHLERVTIRELRRDLALVVGGLMKQEPLGSVSDDAVICSATHEP